VVSETFVDHESARWVSLWPTNRFSRSLAPQLSVLGFGLLERLGGASDEILKSWVESLALGFFSTATGEAKASPLLPP